MLKSKILFFCACLMSFNFALAQNEDAPVVDPAPIRHIIKISPFHFAEGTFLLSYEHMFSKMNSSIMVSAGLHSRTSYNGFNGSSRRPEFGFQEELQYRFYVVPPQNVSRNGRGFWYFKGFYAGPYLQHRYLSRTVSQWDWVLQINTEVDQNLNEVAGGVLLGCQLAMGNKFFIDFFTGGGVKRSFGQLGDNFISVAEPGYNGVLPKVGFQIGIGI